MKIRIHSEEVAFTCFECGRELSALVDAEDRYVPTVDTSIHGYGQSMCCSCKAVFEVEVIVRSAQKSAGG